MHEELLRNQGTRIIVHRRLTGVSYPLGTDLVAANKVAKVMAHQITELHYIENPEKPQQISLWCRGSSGAIIAALVATHLNPSDFVCDIQHIKKKGEYSHSTDYGCYKEENLNFIVDDFISTGNTICKIIIGMLLSSGNNLNKSFHNIHINGLLVSGSYDSDHRIIPCRWDIEDSYKSDYEKDDFTIELDVICCKGYEM